MTAKIADRLFFALLPPSEVLAEIAEQRDALGLARPMRDARLHLTLFLLPDRADGLPADLVARARAVGDAVVSTPFRILLDRVGGRGNAVLLPGESPPRLMAFQRQLAEAAAARGLAPHPRFRFAPHVTLGHGAPGPIDAAIFPVVSWRVDAFALIHSHVGLTRYDLLASWPSRDAAGRDTA